MPVNSSRWMNTTLGDICAEDDGLQTGPFGSQLHADEYTREGVPVVMPKDLVAGRISDAQVARVSPETAQSLAKHRLRQGDVIFGRRGDIGRCALVTDRESDWICGTGCLRARLTDDVVPQFIVYQLGMPKVLDWLEANAVGQTMLNLNTSILAALPLRLPPLPEQRKIAEILSTWDEALALLDRRIELAAQRKQGLMQRLLTGRVRFAEFEGEPWREVRLRDAFTRVTRTTSADIDAVLSITAGVGFEHQREKFGRIIAGKSLKRYTLLRRGEFAYNKGNSLTYPQGCVYLLEEYEEASVPNVYYCFQARSNKVYAPFYKYYFESGALNSELRGLINAGVRNDGLLNLSADDFFGCRILLPPVPEQRRIAEVLDTCDREIELLQRKRELLRQQKKGLMQRLLTGRVRVRV